MGRRYAVNVKLTSFKELKVWASDEGAAMDKAEEICSAWASVDEAEAVDAHEVDEDD